MIRKYTYYIVLLWTALLGTRNTVQAQRVTAVLDREKILLGEQADLQLKLEDFNPRTTVLNSWFTIPDSANHVEFVKKQPIDTIEINGYTTYVQHIAVTSFDSGRWQLPALQLTIQDNASHKSTVYKADDLFLEVLPVDVSNLKDYHAMKDIAEVKVRSKLWLVILIAVLALAAGYFIWRFIRKKLKARPRVQQPKIKGDPLARALELLATLQKEQPASPAEVKQFFIRLDQAVKQYLAETSYPQALHQTSDELMVAMKTGLHNESVRTQFYQLLRLSDAVKFAKYTPAAPQQQEAVTSAMATVKHIDQLRQKTAHVNGVV